MAGLGGFLYRMAPSFWRQYASELQRPIADATRRPAPAQWPDRGLFGAWLGHSTVLLKVDGVTILTDPVFSDRVGIDLGVTTIGVKRLVEPALRDFELPKVDLILLSHAHFDHFDTPSLRALESGQTTVITASQTSDLLRVNKYGAVHELAWGARAYAGSVAAQAIEVNHWGARVRTDTWRGYNGYVLEAGRYRILFAGDTAITRTFGSVKSSRPFDLAIMPIGAYDPWIRYHCTPEQALAMGEMAGADRFVPVHHQTFQLSREPHTEPIERFCQAAGEGARVLARQIGDEFQV
jgi:L-ascorbate metabolism protein UlaG (beta-lactamase superfamily)